MTDDALLVFARHLSLPEIGMAGQEKLLHTVVRVDSSFADLASALVRMGVQLAHAAPTQIVPDATLREGEVLFDGHVAVGPQAFHQAIHRDASAPLKMKQRFFSALVASEFSLWICGQRPAVFSLAIDFPHYRALR